MNGYTFDRYAKKIILGISLGVAILTLAMLVISVPGILISEALALPAGTAFFIEYLVWISKWLIITYVAMILIVFM